MCYDALVAAVEGEPVTVTASKSGTAKKPKKNAKLGEDPNYKAIMTELQTQKARLGGFEAHPKMSKLKMLVIQHFASRTAEPGEDDDKAAENTRVMVFVTFRNCVEEIAEYLNQERPLIKATKFIGQGTDKGGNKGFAQKEQLDVR